MQTYWLTMNSVQYLTINMRKSSLKSFLFWNHSFENVMYFNFIYWNKLNDLTLQFISPMFYFYRCKIMNTNNILGCKSSLYLTLWMLFWCFHFTIWKSENKLTVKNFLLVWGSMYNDVKDMWSRRIQIRSYICFPNQFGIGSSSFYYVQEEFPICAGFC